MTPVPRSVLLTRVADWQARGVIDAAAAERLREDIGTETQGWGFRSFIILAGILCLAFAAITFVASNWEAMPRVLRLALILGLLWISWAGGVWARMRGHPWLGEGLFLLACVIYGAGLALVAQLYHIQGDAPGYILAWALGAIAAAALVRAPMVLALSIGLVTLWHLFLLDDRSAEMVGLVNLPFLGLWLVCALLGWWFGRALAAHLLAISAFIWWITIADALLPRGVEALGTLYLVLTLLALALVGMQGAGTRAARVAVCYLVLLALGVAMVAYGQSYLVHAREGGLSTILGLCAGAIVLGAGAWMQRAGRAEAYEAWVAAIAVGLALVAFTLVPMRLLQAAYVLALAIWFTRMGYRLELRLVRILGMGGFLIGLMLIYGETIGSLIGTAGFYLGAGLVLLGGAWLSTRLHRVGPGDRPGTGPEGAA